MTLKVFLSIIIAMLPIVLIVFYCLPAFSRQDKWSKSPIPYFAVLALATLLSYLTFVHYAKSDGGYYKNTDYHLIQQDGFKYPQGQTLRFASDNSPDSALLATGIGELWLDPSLQLHAEGFKQPLYVEDQGEDNELNFHVVNAIEELSLKDGEELKVVRYRYWTSKPDSRLTREQQDSLRRVVDTLMVLKYEEVKEKGKIDNYRFIFSLSGALHDSIREYDTVSESRFRQGLSLTSVLQRGIKTRLDAAAMSLYGNCYLVRGHYKMDEHVSSKTPKESAPVYLFVDEKLNNDSCFFYINGRQLTIANRQVVVPEMKDRLFYFGLGTSQSQVYKITLGEGEVFVKYRLPKMYHFPNIEKNGETKMYLTTDINDIITHHNSKDYECFYQFNEQLTENSIYKASAVLDFNIDRSGVSLSPIYADRFDDSKDDIPDDIIEEKEFKVKSSSCRGTSNIAQVSYVFRIRNMRENEVFRYSKILYCVMLFMFMVIFFMIGKVTSLEVYGAKKDNDVNKMYILETSVYLVLIAFLTVRLVLLWRLHAFPPIDHVSYLEFTKLTSSGIFDWTIVCIVGVLFLRIVLLALQWRFYRRPNICFSVWVDKFFEWLKKPYFRSHKAKRQRTIKLRSFTVPLWWVVAAILLPVVAYGICLVLGIPEKLRVAAKEAVAPVLAFAINSIFYVLRNSSAGQQTKTERLNRGIFCWIAIILNMVMFVGYLAVVNELGMLFPMVAVFGIWLFIAAIISEKDHIAWKIIMPVAVVLGFVIVFLHVPMEQKPWGKKVISAVPMPSRIRARMETLAYTPTEMMQNHSAKFKDSSMQEILNASSNKWFIDNHLIQRRYIEESNHVDGFALDKEYNQLAVSYEVQTRDVLLLRYIIYEHGKSVAKLLILIFAMLALNVFVVYRREEIGPNCKMPYLIQLPLQSALYLLMFSAYLYLVNENAVVFVGLDFPFLTLTSKVAPLGLLLPLLAMLLPVNMRKMDASFAPDFNGRPVDRNKIVSGVLSLSLVLVFVIAPSYKMKKKLEKQQDTTSFSISMDPLAEFVNNYLNPRFKEYQEKDDEGIKLASKSIDYKDLKDELNVYLQNSTYGFDGALAEFDRKSKYEHQTDDFIKSAFEHLQHTSLTNTTNILHLRKLNGEFVFVTNKVFYDMKPMFDNSSEASWRGNLLAASSISKLTFIGEDGKNRTVDKRESLLSFGDETANKKYFCDAKTNEVSFFMYQIPSKYCYNENQDVFVMVCNPVVRDQIKVAPKDDATSSFRESMGIRVFPNDVVKVGKAAKSFSLATESSHYFSKRIHYNGKDQVIYPMGNKFMFAYNFDQMLYDGYHPKKATDSVRISLDYELLSDVQNYCDSIIRNDDKIQRKAGLSLRYGDGITVTAVDGNGRIRLLADSNPHRMLTMDPNQSVVVKKIMDSIYLNGDNDLERSLLQNRNIAKMPIGPGSTIKVPFYVALLAQVDMPWEKLGIAFPGNNFHQTVQNDSGKDRDLIPSFGPDKLERKHGLGDKTGWDEMKGEYSKNAGDILYPSDFIATSNNFYYGSVLMLGTYHADKLKNSLGGVLAQSSSADRVFPKFVLDNAYYKFKQDYLKDLCKNQTTHALEEGLKDKFRFNTAQKADNLIRFYDRQPVEKLLGLNPDEGFTGMNAMYVYSVLPCYYEYFSGKQSSPQDIYNDHLNLTSGGVQRMDVTPLNMAEMYLRIALQNGYNGSLLTYQDDASGCDTAKLSDIAGFQKRMKDVVYNGMQKVIHQGGWKYRGTLYGNIGKELDEELTDAEIFLYGKTGTAGTTKKTGVMNQANNNYHYAFILSNKNLHENNYDPNGLKVYVVYFGYYNGTLGHPGTTVTRDAIIHKIINSETFRDYWYGSNSEETNNQ